MTKNPPSLPDTNINALPAAADCDPSAVQLPLVDELTADTQTEIADSVNNVLQDPTELFLRVAQKLQNSAGPYRSLDFDRHKPMSDLIKRICKRKCDGDTQIVTHILNGQTKPEQATTVAESFVKNIFDFAVTVINTKAKGEFVMIASSGTIHADVKAALQTTINSCPQAVCFELEKILVDWVLGNYGT